MSSEHRIFIDYSTLDYPRPHILSTLPFDAPIYRLATSNPNSLPQWADSGKMKRKLNVLRQYLDGPERQVLERLLRTDTFDDTSSETQDVWTQASLRPDTRPAAEAPVRTPTFQGKATLQETERAMARVRSALQKPSVTAQHDSDEDTEDEDAEEARARTAHYIFASYIGMPSQLPGQVALSSSPTRESTSDESLAFSSELPQSILPSSPPAQAFPVTPRRTSTKHVKPGSHGNREYPTLCHTPQTIVTTSLASPIQLLSPAPSTRKRRRSNRPPVMPALLDTIDSNHPHSSPEGAVSTISTIHLRQLTRKTTPRPNFPQDPDVTTGGRNPKRQRRMNDKEGSIRPVEQGMEKSVRQDRTVTASTGAGSSTALRTDAARVPTTGPGSRPSSSTRQNKREERKARSAIRDKIARQLSQACPSLVQPSYRTKMDRSPQSTESAAVMVVSSSEPEEHERCPPAYLPSRDSQVSTDVDMDVERSKELARKFQADYANGLRPGVVIPVLECLKSQ